MNIYSVYVNLNKKEQDPVIIKQGISFVAGIFTFAWALYYKMWFIAFLAIAANAFAYGIDVSYIANFINMAILFFFAFFAGDLREFYVTKNGAELFDIIIAHDAEEAELKYYIRSNINK